MIRRLSLGRLRLRFTLILALALIYSPAWPQTKMSVMWDKKSTKETVIERKPGPITNIQVAYTMIGKAPPGLLYYADSTITPGGEYCYRVYEAGTYNYSTPVCEKALLTPPKFPMVIAPVAVTWVIPPLVKCSATDWVGLYEVGKPDTDYLLGLWRYTNCEPSGTFAVAPPKTGSFNFRYMLNDGFKSAWVSNTINASEIGPGATGAAARSRR